MIASVSGPATWVGLDRVVVDLHGVGMLVHTPPAVAAGARVGQPVELATTLVVREDSLTLYGFASPGDRDTFELLQTVSGVGPRVALAILSVLSPDEVAAAVSTGDVATLTKVPGIGKKGAERLVLELRDKLVAAGATTPGTVGAPAATSAWQEQVVEALVGLGYSAKQAESATTAVAASTGESPAVSDALRAALRELAR